MYKKNHRKHYVQQSEVLRGGRRINIVVDGSDNFPVANILYDGATDSMFINRGASPMEIDAALDYIVGIVSPSTEGRET